MSSNDTTAMFMDAENAENAENGASLDNWEAFGVSTSSEQLDVSFRNILARLDAAMDDQLRNVGCQKRRTIVESVKGAIECTMIKVSERLGTRSQDPHSSFFEEVGMTQEELRTFLPLVSAHSQALLELSTVLGCEQRQVLEVVKTKNNLILELQDKLAADRLQLEKEIEEKVRIISELENQKSVLQDQVIRLSSTSAAAAHSSVPPISGESDSRLDHWHAVRSHFDLLKGIQSNGSLQVTIGSPHMSDGQPQHRIAPSRAWSRQSSPESSQGRSNGESMSLTTYGSRHRLNGEDRVDNMFTVFREVFKAQSVANVPKYNGKNSLTDFLRALDVKFPSTVWGDSDRRDILVNHLEGTALSLVKGLPLAIREGSFFDVVDALKAARRNPCERLKNVREWEQLSKRANESVVDFCCRMEQLSRRIHPSSEWDFIRGSKLYSCLQQWQDSYHMLAALDAAEGHVYEEVRRVAMRLERLQPDALRFPTTSSNKGGIDRKAINATHVDNGARLGAGSKADRPPLKCFNCGGIGHSAYKCKKPKRPFQQRDHVDHANATNGRRYNGNTVGGISLADKVEGWCKTVRMKPNLGSTQPQAMGKPCTCDVKIFGISAKALVDTGSVVSIIPVGLLKQARDQGVDLDNQASVVGDGKQRKLIDASGNPMSFLSEIVTEVSVPGASAACVHMHVQQSKDNTLLLGTNALFELGISLKLSPSTANRDCNDEGASLKHGSFSNLACTNKRVVIAPGTVSTVQIKSFKRQGACVLWSRNPCIESGVCQITEGKAEISVVNRGNESWVINKGENIGEWSADTWVDPRIADIPGDMLCLHQSSEPEGAERTDLLIATLDTNRRAGPMPREVREVVVEFSEVFAISDTELTQTTLVQHDIDIGEHPPIKQKTRPVPYGIRDKVHTMLQDLKERNVIEDSQSPWASPIVLVAKKDGTTRLCVDYREVNKVTKKDSYPLPPIDITLQNLQGKRWFTSLDLASGYWQVPLTDRAKEVSAFTTTSGQFQFRVLPFGLTTAPAKFQRLMDKVLGNLIGPEVSVYIDDILIATDSVHRHVEVLRNVLLAFRNAQLKVKPQKCRLMEPSLEFLGHVVDASGVRADPEKVSRIRDYARPQNVAQLRTFLGMAGYYRKFVLKFSQISKPLFELTSTKRIFLWSDEHDMAFEALKRALMKAPVLVQPNIEKARDGSRPFIIYTDASRKGIGAVLAQEGDDSLLHPVFFASKHLTNAERNYHVTDQEALALVFGLKKFHYFIYGVPAIVRTDHAALTSLFKRTNVSPRVLRWALEVQRYDLTIEYVKGTANAVADALSRGLPPSQGLTQGYAEDEKVICAVQEDEWLTELRQDSEFSEAISAVENNRIEEVKLPRHNKLLSSADFVIQNGKLHLIVEDGTLAMVIPRSRRKDLFDEAHSGVLGGHFGAYKMFAQMRKTLFWPGMYQDLVSWCRSCQQCFVTNHKSRNIPPLRPIEVIRPLQIVGIDLLEMGLTTRGNRYIVTIIDHFTKYLGAYPIADKRAETVAEVVFSNWICGAGRWPEILLSDRGSEFENEIVAALCSIMGIEQKFTKGYCPRENGLTERVNGTIVRMLKKKTVVPAEWDRVLPTVVYAYNASAHTATGESPHFLLYGTDPKYPSAVIPSDQLSPYLVDYDDYKTELLAGLKLARQLICENAEHYRERMKIGYDSRWKTSKSTVFKAGDRVYMKLPAEKGKSRHPKLAIDWAGPFRVIEASANSALVTLIGENKEPSRVQFDHLLKVPREIDDTRLTGVTQRGKRKRKVASIKAIDDSYNESGYNYFHFSNIKSSSSNVRHIDWKCPGEMLINGQRVACTVNVPISNLLPSAPLSSFAFQSPYELARALAVISQTHVPEHFRLARMLDSSYDIVTPTSVGLAIAFYRSHCIHMTFAAVEDTAKITPGYPPRSNSDPYNLPSIYSDAVKFADMHPWTATSWKLLQPRRTLVILPEGFQDVLECFESSLMSARLAREPDDVQPRWFEEEFSAVIIFSPARFVEVSRWRSAWFLIMQAVARGAELIALAGPKDDQDWGKAVDQLRDIIEETITQRPSLERRIRCLLPLKSEEFMQKAPFRILADKINLVSGRHFTQSAAKRFWMAVLETYNSVLRLPAFHRISAQPKKPFQPRNVELHQQSFKAGRGNERQVAPRQHRSCSRSRPFTTEDRYDFNRRSLRGRGGRATKASTRSGSASFFRGGACGGGGGGF